MRFLFTVLLLLSLYRGVAAGQLDLISGGGVNHLNVGSGDGRTFSGWYDSCGPGDACEVPLVIFNRVTSEVVFHPFAANGFSYDGTFAVGTGLLSSGGLGSVYRSIADATNIDLPRHFPTWELTDISSDGLTVLGKRRDTPYVWNAAGRHRIGGPRHVNDTVLSGDGSVVFGVLIDDAGQRAGLFRWTAEHGAEVVARLNGRVSDVSADGSIVVGTNETGGFRWTQESGFEELPILPQRLSGDGSVVFGRRPNSSLDVDTIIWTEDRLLSFREFIHAETGVDVGSDVEITDISHDGKTLSGIRRSSYRNRAAIILRIGEFESCDLNADNYCNALDIDAMATIPQMMLRTAFDLNGDNVHDFADRRIWTEDLMSSRFGDANLDRQFDTSDLLHVFKTGYFEQGELSSIGWNDGDWNGDHKFDSSDIILAFSSSSFEAVALVVSEPNCAPILFMLHLAAFGPVIRYRWSR